MGNGDGAESVRHTVRMNARRERVWNDAATPANNVTDRRTGHTHARYFVQSIVLLIGFDQRRSH